MTSSSSLKGKQALEKLHDALQMLCTQLDSIPKPPTAFMQLLLAEHVCRLNIQEASLLRARQDQEALIAKLTDSTAYGSD